ncbi:MAG: thiamine phosphate synthase, partial [Thermodesulfobacteriota bacterium]
MGPLYLVTDRSVVADGDIVKAVRLALLGGVRAVQLREKDLGAHKLFELAVELRALTNEHGALLFINDRLDVALLVDADGIHLGQNSFSAKEARPHLRPHLNKGMLIGVSTHSLAEAKRAEADGADFVTFGPVYATPSKAAYGEPVGVSSLKEAASVLKIPVFAIGGMTRA